MRSTTIIVCNTCGHNSEQPEAVRPGEKLATVIEDMLAGDASINLRRFSCLMACQRMCTVQLRSIGKMDYALGDFIPDYDHASALVEYTRLYHESETGQVPYKQWPVLIKGKFLTRIPVLDVANSNTYQE